MPSSEPPVISSPTAAGTRSPTPARCTATAEEVQSGSASGSDHPVRRAARRARAGYRRRTSTAVWEKVATRSRTRSTRAEAPRSRTSRACTSTSTATRRRGAVRADAAGAPYGERGEEPVHGRRDLPRGPAPRAGRGVSPRPTSCSMARRSAGSGLVQGPPGCGEVRPPAGAGDADLRRGVHRRGRRRRDDGGGRSSRS